MSRTVDEYVASMEFDNKRFERNVQTSIGTLDKLKQSLNLSGASKGLENVSAAAKRCDFAPMSDAIHTVGLKFSGLYTIADQALRNITTRVQNCAEQMVKSFTIDPIKMGFSEYETQIGAIQTILANTQSKGSTLDDVNRALDELNTYADKTIYNFTQMTKNIGTFTAAGVDLDKSVSSIKGIANLAAVSGSTSQQASTAMYQLSQALASGTVRLQDWNSVVNAGMGGEVFQNALKRTATKMGHNVDELIQKYGSFRESLTQGEWLTTEVLTETLTQLSGAYTEADLIAQGYTEKQAKEIVELANTAVSAATDVKTFTQLMDTLKESAQSGWTQTWELLIGDFGQAKKLWSGASKFLGDIISNSAQKRNDLLSGSLDSNWDKMTDKLSEYGVGVSDLEEAIKKASGMTDKEFDSMVKSAGSLEEAIQKGAVSVDVLKKALSGLKGSSSEFNFDSITRNLKYGLKGDDVREIENALKSLGYDFVGKDGKDYSGDGFYGELTAKAVKEFQKANNLKVTGIVDEETIAALEKATAKSVEFKESIDDLVAGVTELGGRQKLIESFKNVWAGLENIVSPIKDAFGEIFPPVTVEQLNSFIQRIHDLTAAFKEWTISDNGKAVISNLTSAFKGFFSVIDIGWTFIKELAGGVWKLLGNFGGLATGVIGAAGSLGEWITGLRKSIKEGDVFGKAITAIVGFLGNVIDKVKIVFNFLKEKIAMPGLEGFLSIMSGIWNIITKVGSKIGEVISNIASAFGDGNFSSLFDILNSGLITGILLGVKKFTDGGGSVFGGIVDILDSVKGCFEAWQNDIQANTLLKIAGAIGILAAALLVIASIEPAKLTGALLSITVLFADLVGSMALLNKIGGGIKGVTSMTVAMIGISTAVLILASALKKISGLGWEEVGKGLVGVAGLMAIVVVAANKLSSNEKSMLKGAGQMVLLAGALKLLASVCKDFSQMSWEGILKGVAAIGILLYELTIFTESTGEAKNLISGGASLILIAAAMKVLASAAKDFSSMNWEELGKGLLGMAVSLGMLIVAINAMPTDVSRIGVGLVLVSGALIILAEALSRIGNMSWDTLAQGLTALGISLVMFGFGLNMMTGTLPGAGALAVASASLLLLAGGLKAIGSMEPKTIIKALLAIAGAFAVIGVAGLLLTPVVPGILALAGAFALIGVGTVALGAGLLAVSAGITALATAGAAGATAIVAALSVIVVGIADLIPTVAAKIGEGIVTFCEVIADSATAIGECVLEVISGVLSALAEHTPTIVDSLFGFIIGIIDSIAARTPELVESLVNLFTSLMTSVIDVLCGLDTSTIVDTLMGVGVMSAITVALSAISSFIPGAMAGVLGLGGLVAEIGIVLAALGALNQIPGLDWLISEGGDMLTNIGNAIGGFVGGIVGGVAEGLTASLPDIGTNLSTFMTNLGPFIEGAKTIDAAMLEGVQNIVSIITTLTAANLLEGITSLVTGESSLTKFGEEIVPFGTALSNFAAAVSGIDEAAVTAAANAGIMLTNMATNIPNSGGLVSFFTGDNNMETFATEIVKFGTALASFSTTVSGIDEAAVTAAANAGIMLTNMATNIPNSGGLVSFFTGDNNMETFGTGLVDFGTALASFSTAVSGIDEAAVTTAANVGTILTSMASTIPNSGGLVSFFTGDNDLATFATEVVEFGEGIKGFSDSVSGIDIDAVGAATDAGTKLSTMANGIPNSGGLFSWFSGDNDLATFGVKLKEFGAGIKGFSDEVVGLDMTACGNAALAATSLSSLATTLSSNSDSVGKLPDYGEDIWEFGENINLFNDEIKGIDTAKLSSISTSLSGLASITTSDSEALKSFTTSLGEIGTEGVDKFIEAFTDADVKALEAGAKLLENLINGVKSKKDNLKTPFVDAITKAYAAVMSEYKAFYSAGKFLVQGFANGISANTYMARAKAAAMANAAANAARAALDEHSPSKIGYEIGDFFGMPFVDAIASYIPKAYGVGSDLGSSATNGLNRAISKARFTLENGIDAQPTITPVLDLSEIRAGASSINGIFGMTPSITAMANIRSASTMMNSRQNGNNDVITAIKDLGRKVGNTPSNTYQINGITYDDGSNISEAMRTIVRAARIERRT